MLGTSESENFICFSSEIDFPKMGILEVDKSKPIPKLAQDGQDKNWRNLALTKIENAFAGEIQ